MIQTIDKELVDFVKEEIRQHFPGALMPPVAMSFETFNEWINRPMAFDGFCTPSRRPMTGVYMGAQETEPQCACVACRAISETDFSRIAR